MEYAEWIEREMEELMKEGGEYNPFRHFNILEALSEMDDGAALNVTASIASAEDLPDNSFAQDSGCRAVRNAIRNYWTKMAKHKAELNWEEYRCASLNNEDR
jgi:hypothetical protein